MARGNRFLAPRRISRKTDESTSVDTQLDAVSRYAQAYDLQLIPVVPDLDVSGARPIRERPGVGPWLAEERLGEGDGIITYRLDRCSGPRPTKCRFTSTTAGNAARRSSRHPRASKRHRRA